MSAGFTVAVDAMGGDRGTGVIVEGVRQVLATRSDANLLLVGDPEEISRHIGNNPLPKGRAEIVEAAEVVSMDDTVAVALRNKKQSSMRIAIDQVKSGRASACVSSGNTSALMAISKFVLKTVPGIDRPAICTTIPALNGHTHMLDLGANVDCSADHLYQFAAMGSILAQAIDANSRPTVGLLNIGSEEIKGNDQVKEAAELLSDSTLNYIGFVEGNEIYTDRADIVVCDGFVGNVSLKTSEGVAHLVSVYLKEEFMRSPINKLVGLLAKPILRSFGNRIDPRQYNGASLLGLKGVVIKSHGSADAVAFANAIDIALLEIANDVPSKITESMNKSHNSIA